ncbi:hypothetical protein GCM10009678_83790 [Actinomadura kijaniata]|uniref:Lipoprotein n=1 Tax=Actinomadura namibiensis TaxID=182080 RepID=A0A7W3QPU8_ACTNM|nr:hypothetical protein [Actinomadura namibiensis]MBA8955034.1 hypothetical protein [Actinomadura namibiensis]
MRSPKPARAMLTILAASAAAGGLLTLTAPAASAHGGCGNQGYVVINDGGGAEPPSNVYGHSHTTGEHYVHHVRRNSDGTKTRHWYEDNDTKLLPDRDKPDTPYRTDKCALNVIP